MKRILATFVVAGLLGALIAGCHASASGGVNGNDTTSMVPGR
ncbi:MAG TPA: hypothetical protein VN541_04255 [Tepidisphaeraceae bacterium]|nr:hypothetical protein [Tepidisphaeraceae bacterium]